MCMVGVFKNIGTRWCVYFVDFVWEKFNVALFGKVL